MSEPHISVGLPVFNGAAFLGAALDSILSQDTQDFEIVISDNASTDGTQELCEAYARVDRRIRVFRQARNIGAPANWNFVARAAHGTYFKWASASDLCAPRLLSACAERLDSVPDAVLAYPRTVYIDDEGRETGGSKRDLEILDPCPAARFKRVSAGLSINNAQQGLIRHSALMATRLDRLYPGGDLVLMAELALLGKFVLVPERLLLRRASPEHWTANRSAFDVDRMFWPDGPPRLRLVNVRRHLDYLRTALTARLPLRARLEAAGFALKHAYWSRGVLRADLGQLIGRGRQGAPP